jgi:hypothetical protein
MNLKSSFQDRVVVHSDQLEWSASPIRAASGLDCNQASSKSCILSVSNCS